MKFKVIQSTVFKAPASGSGVQGRIASKSTASSSISDSEFLNTQDEVLVQAILEQVCHQKT